MTNLEAIIKTYVIKATIESINDILPAFDWHFRSIKKEGLFPYVRSTFNIKSHFFLVSKKAIINITAINKSKIKRIAIALIIAIKILTFELL